MKVLPYIVVASVDATPAQRGAANYLCDGVDDESQINSAITEANAAGGGWVMLTAGSFTCGTIILKSNVVLTGNGVGTIVTLKDNGDTYLLSTSDGVVDFGLRDITFDGNKANQTDTTKPVLYIDNTSGNDLHSSFTRIRVHDGKGVGLYAIWPRRIQVIDSHFLDNDSHGIQYTKGHMEMIGLWSVTNGGDGLNVADMEDTHITSCSFTHNDGNGINLVKLSSIEGCVIYGNDLDGISELQDANCLGCTIRHNKGSGIKKMTRSSVVGCFLNANYKYGIGEWGCTDSHIIGSIIRSNSNTHNDTYPEVYISNGCTVQNSTIGYSLYIYAKYSVQVSNTGKGNIIANNRIFEALTCTLFSSGFPNDTLPEANAILNNTMDIAHPNQTAKLYKNTSGGALSLGHVVIRKSVAGLDEITTTTTIGDVKVLGMVAQSIANNAFGKIQTTGKTVSLKVNGTVAIGIGDFLCCHSVAGISQKASAGHTVFAIAKEAYAVADSNGVIDAEVIVPFKI